MINIFKLLSIRSFELRFTAVAAVVLLAFSAFALTDGLPKDISDLHRFKAESWSVVGRNLHLKGNIHIPAKDVDIRADEAIVNLDTRDLEAFGNVSLHNWKKVSANVSPSELGKLEQHQGLVISIDGIDGDIWGEKSIKVSGRALTDTIYCRKL